MRREDEYLLQKAKELGLDRLQHETERKLSKAFRWFAIFWIVSVILVGAWLFNLGRETGKSQGEKTGWERAVKSADYRQRHAQHLEALIRVEKIKISSKQEKLVNLQEELRQFTNATEQASGTRR